MDFTTGQPPATIMEADTDTVGLDHSPILTDTTAKVTIAPAEAVLGHLIGTTGDIIRVIHGTHTQICIHTILSVTLHIEDILHTGAHQPTPETREDHALDQPTNQLRKPYIKNSSHFRRSYGNTHTKRNSRVTIDDPQTDFYSSDDHSSDSEEDPHHLN